MSRTTSCSRRQILAGVLGAGIALMNVGKISRTTAEVNNIENVQAPLLIDYAAAADGWNVINYGIGPSGELTLLLSDVATPYQTAPEYTGPIPSGKLTLARYRLIQFGTGDHGLFGPIATLELSATEDAILSANRLVDGRWLVVRWRADDGRNAQVLSDDGEIETRFSAGLIEPVQVTGDGRFWGGYGDEDIFAGDDLTASGIACLDMMGRPLFRFNQDAADAGGAPFVWSSAGINVVTDDEVWVSYYADWPLESDSHSDEGYALVKLRDYAVERVWPWRIVREQAPADPPGSFAIDGDRLLLQGTWEGLGNRMPTPDHPFGRLYSVPLGGGGATAMLPVDESGEWIGPFRSEGRGSRLYLTTWQGLRLVDLATLPLSE